MTPKVLPVSTWAPVVIAIFAVVGFGSRSVADDRDEMKTCAKIEATQTAIEACTRVIDRKHAEPGLRSVAYSNRCGARATIGQNDLAIRDCAEALRYNSSNYQAWGNRGAAFQAKGELEKAIADFTKAIELKPDYAPYHSARGDARRGLGRHDEEAIADYTTALGLSHDLIAALLGRAAAYEAVNQYANAAADYTRLIELSPEHQFASYLARGEIYADMDKPDLAEKDFTRAIDLRPNAVESYIRRGDALTARGNPSAAIDDYERALQRAPGNPFALHGRGMARGELGEMDAALADLREAQTLHRPLQMWHDIECQLPIEKRKPRRTILACTMTIENGHRGLSTLSIRAWAYAALGEHDRAIADYTVLIDRDESADRDRRAARGKPKPRPGWLGIGLEDDAKLAGPRVTNVTTDGPAAEAGFQPGDVIRRIGNEDVRSGADVARIVAALPIGNAADIVIERNGARRVLKPAIGENKLDEAEKLQRERSDVLSPVDPNGALLYMKRAESYAAKGDHKHAIADWTAAIERYGRGWAGITTQANPRGALVDRVVPDGPAERAGIRAGDVVLSVDGEPVLDANLRNMFSYIPISDVVPVELLRDGNRLTLELKVGRLPGAKADWGIEALEGRAKSHIATGQHAAAITDYTAALTLYGFGGVAIVLEAGGAPGSVKVAMLSDTESAVDDTKLEVGDVIVRIDGVQLTSPDQLPRRAAKFDGARGIDIEVVRQGKPLTITGIRLATPSIEPARAATLYVNRGIRVSRGAMAPSDRAYAEALADYDAALEILPNNARLLVARAA